MSTIRVNNLQNTSTTDGGISINNSGHVTVDGVAMPSAGPLSNRNLIINGAMLIDQRNGGSSTTPTTDQTYVFDRWKIRNAGGTGRFSVEQSGSSPNNIDPSMLLTVTTTATPGASEFYAVEQSIEGYNFAKTAAGSATSEILTLSFSVRSSLTGTYCCSLRNSDASRSFVAEYTINTADTWETKTIEVPAITSGTWNTTTGTGASLDFCLGAGSNFEGSTGWQSVNRVATSNQVDWINSSGATFYITGVQLEVGSVATPFEHRSYGDELQRCERYFQQFQAIQFAAVGSSSVLTYSTNLHPPMRATPTYEVTGALNAQQPFVHDRNQTTAHVGIYTGAQNTEHGGYLRFNNFSGGGSLTTGTTYMLMQNSSYTDRYLTASAEL